MQVMEMDKTMHGSRELEFAIFCIENVASKLNVDATKVYAALTEQTDILNEYIIPEYEVLHTQSKEYIVNDIIDIMKERSDIFLKEAKDCGLDIYPYKEGFFVTLKIEDQKLAEKVHSAFMDHHIYTVLVNKGIRVAVCSVSVPKVKGLAKKMKDIINSLSE